MTERCVLCPSTFDGKLLVEDGIAAEQVRSVFLHRCNWAWGMEVIVMKRILGVLFVLVVLQCVLSSPSAAQSCVGKLATQIWEWPNPVPSGWFYFAPYPAPFAYLIASWTGSCPPPSHCSTCNNGSGNGGIPTATQPINLTNGNTYVQESDVRLPGLGGGLTLQRTWNSMWPAILSGFQTGMFGPNWRSTVSVNRRPS